MAALDGLYNGHLSAFTFLPSPFFLLITYPFFNNNFCCRSASTPASAPVSDLVLVES
jgi:hypothetical protein